MKKLDFLQAKVDGTADSIRTQLFCDNRDSFDVRDRCDLIGIEVPILAGILQGTGAAAQRDDFLDHEVAGIHFYALNKGASTPGIVRPEGEKALPLP